jgi:hypothetical protein
VAMVLAVALRRRRMILIMLVLIVVLGSAIGCLMGRSTAIRGLLLVLGRIARASISCLLTVACTARVPALWRRPAVLIVTAVRAVALGWCGAAVSSLIVASVLSLLVLVMMTAVLAVLPWGRGRIVVLAGVAAVAALRGLIGRRRGIAGVGAA